MTYFAIKHTPSGMFLPIRAGRQRGYTNDEPTNAKPPRLFMSARNAKLALAQWLQGPLTVSYYEDHNGELGESWDRGKHDRKAEDMQIVELELHEVVR